MFRPFSHLERRHDTPQFPSPNGMFSCFQTQCVSQPRCRQAPLARWQGNQGNIAAKFSPVSSPEWGHEWQSTKCSDRVTAQTLKIGPDRLNRHLGMA